MKRKRIVLILLTLCMIGALCSCSSSREKTINPNAFEEQSIVTTAPPKLLKWSESDLAKLLPKPEYKYGEIKTDNNKEFFADIQQVSIEDYSKYEKLCIEKGFSVEAKKEENSYSAKNKNGDSLSISFDDDIISITLKAVTYNVEMEITCVENLIFSKYDIDVSIDDHFIGNIKHGATKNFIETLTKGTHTILFKNSEDSETTGTIEVNITSNTKLQYKLYCTMLGISVTDLNEQPTTQEETTAPITNTQESKNEDTPENYSTNNSSTVRNGNSGVYSYKSRGGSYYVYYIIDFDNGYVYYFTEGNGNDSCMRTKIESGDLNDVLIITYHDGDTSWSEGLHFKYVEQPSHLIVQDNDGFEYDYYPTNLQDALAIRDKKSITDY